MPRPKKLGQYAPLSAGYYRDDAILEAGEKAEILYVRGLAYCSESMSDGYISDRQVVAVIGIGMRDAMARAARLVDVGAWERTDGGFVVRAWLKWNASAEEIGRQRKRDRDRKARPRAGIQTDSAGIPDGIEPEPDPDHDPDSSGIPDGIRTDSVPGGRARSRARPIQIQSISNPVPATPAGDVPETPTEGQRVNRLTKHYTDHPNVSMSNFPAIAGVVRKAVQSARYDDDAIRDALGRLAVDGRSVSVDTLRIELDGLPPHPSRPRDGPRRSTADDRVNQALAAGREIQALTDAGQPNGQQPRAIGRVS